MLYSYQQFQRAKPKSNTGVVVVPCAIWIALWLVYEFMLKEPTNGAFSKTFTMGLGLPFMMIAVAQLRSGYFWQNGANGNRGLHKHGLPKRFKHSNVTHLSIGLSVVLFIMFYL